MPFQDDGLKGESRQNAPCAGSQAYGATRTNASNCHLKPSYAMGELPLCLETKKNIKK
jgi:hypothetical protein